MVQLNRKVEYALMALKVLFERRPGELISVKAICELTGAPFDGTSRVLQQMVQKEVLKSVMGPSGGYCIVKDLKDLSFFELSEMVLGPVALAKCLKAKEGCELLESCNIASPISNLNEKMIQFYKSISVLEIINPRWKKGELDLKDMALDKAARSWS